MKRFNITDEKFPMTELVLDINQFELPKVWRADFSKAQVNNAVEYINGQRNVLENIANIVVPMYDDLVVSALEKLNVSISTLKHTEIEFVGDFVNIQNQVEQEGFTKIKLVRPQIKLKSEVVNKQIVRSDNQWATVRAINSVKIVAEGMQLVADE